MTSKVLENFFAPPSTKVNAPELQTDEADSKNPVYGIDRSRKAMMLSIRKHDGTGKLIPYAQILDVDFTAEKLITLHCSGATVTIEGEHLGTLLERLSRYEVSYIQEGNPGNPVKGPEGESIREIRLESLAG